MSAAKSRSLAGVVLRIVVMLLITLWYLLLWRDELRFASARRSPDDFKAVLFTTYTLLSLCLPLVLAVVFALSRSRFAVWRWIEALLTAIVVANALPLCVAVLRWVPVEFYEPPSETDDPVADT